MESVSVKFDENVLKNVDKSIKENNYSTRTEFIREAVRDKLSKLEKEEAIKHFEKYFGKSKKKTSYKRHREIREQVSKDIAREYGLD